MLFDQAGIPVTAKLREVTVTPTVLNNDAYDSGDVLFDSTLVANACRDNDEPCWLDSMTIQDKDDQAAAAWTLFFLSANTSLGTKDAAPSISDPNAATAKLMMYPVAVADWFDYGAGKLAHLRSINLPIIPVSGTRDIYVAATVTGTPTQTTGGIVCRLIFKDPS
jgi:hypothetical protein